MDLDPGFIFRPLPPVEHPVHLPFPTVPHPLGPLAELAGTWKGRGFNTIWRPHFLPPGSPPPPPGQFAQDRFLELNLTNETLEFTPIPGAIPNRGLLQSDINMFGLHYLQQISDANLGAGLHIEPGIWAAVPLTTDPAEPPTVVRMASIPHGTTMLAQGQSFDVAGGPLIKDNNINAFPFGSPGKAFPLPEQNLGIPTNFRSPAPQLKGITQAMVDNPNSVLKDAIKGQNITRTIVLSVNTHLPTLPGGGTSNTAFLEPNARAVEVEAIFWLETVAGEAGHPPFLQLQYTQTVLLNFAKLTWPHVTVATLTREVAKDAHPKGIDPDADDAIEQQYYDTHHPVAA